MSRGLNSVTLFSNRESFSRGWDGYSDVGDGRDMGSLNLTRAAPLPTPGELREQLPRTLAAERTVRSSTEALTRALSGEDHRLLLVVGPCSIHDPAAALEYGRRLRTLAEEGDAAWGDSPPPFLPATLSRCAMYAPVSSGVKG